MAAAAALTLVSFGIAAAGSSALAIGPAVQSVTVIADTVFTPADDAGGVDATTDLVMSFDEDVQAGVGDITLHRAADDAVVEAFDVTGPAVDITGAVVTIDPTALLDDLTEYYVVIDAGAITDLGSPPDEFPGISDPTVWNFTTADVTAPTSTLLEPANGALDVNPLADLAIAFDEYVQAGIGDITVYRGSHQELFIDPLDDASLLTVTTGAFFADNDPAFDPDAIFGVNDGVGGGDFGGDTPGDRTTYAGFTGGFLEANGLNFGGSNPVVVEWNGIDVTGATDLEFSVDLASALQPDTNDFVRFEARVDGGSHVEILSLSSAATNDVFTTALGESLTSSAQNFRRVIPGTGTTLDIRATLSLSGTALSGDDIAIDNVSVSGGGVGTSTEVERLAVGGSNVSFVDSQAIVDPITDLDANTSYYVVVRPGVVTDQATAPNEFGGILSDHWGFTTGDLSTPPVFSTSFAPDSIIETHNSTLTLTIDNTAGFRAATALDVTDNLPAGLVVATPPAASTTCTGGTLTAVAASSTVSLSGASVAAGASCTVSVDVTADADGALVNTTGDLTSSLGNSGTATATLTVAPQTPPTVTIDQAAAQEDPTADPAVTFTVAFSEDVNGFDLSDIAVSNGTATGLAATTPNREFTVTVEATEGDVVATIPAGAATDSDGTPSVASTSTDNLVRVDTTDPVIETPATITVPNDPGTDGAVVDYDVSVTDEGETIELATDSLSESAPLVTSVVEADDLSCAPASGSTFPIGTTTVTCNATDATGNTSSASFDVIVEDDEAPVVVAPADITSSAGPGPVDYELPTLTDNSGAVLGVTCAPPPGSVFPVGTTTVTCTGADEAGNTTTVTFTISVTDATLPATGGGLGAMTLAAQLLVLGVLTLAVSRIRRRTA